MDEDDIILKEYKEAFKKYSKEGVVDLDEKLKHKFSFAIHRLEYLVSKLEGILPPNRNSRYFVFLIKSGSGQESIGPFNFSIEKNTLFCIPKRVINSSQHFSSDSTGYVISFNIDFFLQNAFPRKLIAGKKIFKISIKPYLILSAAQKEKLEVIFEYILKECKEGFFNTQNELIAIKTLELLIVCDHFFMEAQSDGNKIIYNDVLEKFSELLDKNFIHHRSVKFYADSMHVHPNHLNYLTQKHSGLSAKETINNYILNEAKYLLASTSLSVKEIAYELGFESPDYFYSFFRRKLNMSPAQYRTQLV